jgi:DNA-binding transcriptional MerR regulator
MPIGEFSLRSGLSAKRLRSYAAGGLLLPAAVDSASGYRYYSPSQLRDASLIDALREAVCRSQTSQRSWPHRQAISSMPGESASSVTRPTDRTR